MNRSTTKSRSTPISLLVKTTNVHLEPLYDRSPDSCGIKAADEFGHKYYLKDISRHVGVHEVEGSFRGGRGDSEKLACETLQKLFDGQYEIKSEVTLKDVKDGVPSIYVDARTRYDVVAYADGTNPFLFFEIQSSPMRETLDACIWKASVLFRYFRLVDNKFDKIVIFALPSITSNSCIVKVEMIFQKLQFHYCINCYDLGDGINAIKEIANDQVVSIPPLQKVKSRYFMQLTKSEIKEICECMDKRCEQVDSQYALLIHCKGKNCMYKVLYIKEQINNVILYESRIENVDVRHVISIYMEGWSPLVYKYSRVSYGPLKRAEAQSCLQDFVSQVMVALQEFHMLKLAHYDIRLPNFCFNENFEVVIIDVDFSTDISRHLRSMSDSCLYCIPDTLLGIFKSSNLKPGQKIDYMQVGWMIGYIIDDTTGYHERNWDSQQDKIKDNLFIQKLIREFQYEESLLSHLDALGGSKTVRDVLLARSSQRKALRSGGTYGGTY